MQTDESVKPDRSSLSQDRDRTCTPTGYPLVADSLCFETVPLGTPRSYNAPPSSS